MSLYRSLLFRARHFRPHWREVRVSSIPTLCIHEAVGIWGLSTWLRRMSWFTFFLFTYFFFSSFLHDVYWRRAFQKSRAEECVHVRTVGERLPFSVSNASIIRQNTCGLRRFVTTSKWLGDRAAPRDEWPRAGGEIRFAVFELRLWFDGIVC